MDCPICNWNKSFEKEHPLVGDVIEKKENRIILSGKVNAITDSINYPFEGLWTVILYPERDHVHHLKFMTRDEIEKLELKEGEKVILEGCCHRDVTRNRPVVFDIKRLDC